MGDNVDDELIRREVEYQHEQYLDMENMKKRIVLLELRLESVMRKVFGLPTGVRVVYLDEDILDEMETGTPVDYGAGSAVYFNDKEQLVYGDGSRVLNNE